MNTTTLDVAQTLEPAQGVQAEPSANAEPAASAVHEHGPEIAVSGLLMALGGLVVFDSLRLGAGWADDGPQSGYFPFYIGLMLLLSSGFILFKALTGLAASRRAAQAGEGAVFVEREQLRLVMAMLVPASIYVGVMAYTGLYLASVVLIGWFMRRHGGFGWLASTAVSLGVPLTAFMVFERWFLVPLPKGPIEQLLGF